MSKSDDDARRLTAAAAQQVAAPRLPYRPPMPRSYRPRIGLIGCGGIAATHLEAYRNTGWEVAALCDRDADAAEARREEWAPGARVETDEAVVYADPAIEVIDLATHPDHRRHAIRSALDSGKHVLSQKPFVTDLAVGEELVKLADERGVRLAVNQNGRWAPYFAYLREAVRAGLLGRVRSIDIQVAWDHRWIDDSPFVRVPHVILYDFAIHWFDIVACVLGERGAGRFDATTTADVTRVGKPPLVAQASLQYADAAATLAFRGDTGFDPAESITFVGDAGVFRSFGPVCGATTATLTTAAGRATVSLEGQWFPDGFAGAMGELLRAIEDDREPENSARANLRSLEIGFAAVTSAELRRPIDVGSVRRLEPEWVRTTGGAAEA